jgi:hypothetical protein
MKTRNREVNIFNMSLLDILCGALGAFCFLMLSLFPDHAKAKELQAKLDEAMKNGGASAQQQIDEAKQRAKEAEKEADKAKAEQSLIYMQVAWNGGQDVDLWLQTKTGYVFTAKDQDVPADKRAAKTNDRTKGPAKEVVWLSDIAYPGTEYRLFARIYATNGDPSPVRVHAYMIGRVPSDEGKSSVMGLFDIGEQTLTKERELIELGSLSIVRGDFDVTIGPKTPAPAANGASGGRDERAPRMLTMDPRLADSLRFLAPRHR